MKGWQEILLKDVVLKITKGTTPTTLGYDFVNEGINFIKAESITRAGKIVESTFAKIDEKTHNILKRSQIVTDDILVTIAGIYLGKIGLVKKHHTPANTNQAVAIVRPNKKKTVPSFVKYFLINPSTTTYLNMLCPQSAQPNLNLTQLGRVKFRIPPLPIQRRIAAVLSAYDDLIENNNRRIAILEKIAEELYREWFVRMLFPGHEKVKIVKGVPEGWEVKRFGEIVSYYIGGGWGEESQDIHHSVGAHVIRGTDIPGLKTGDFALPPFRYHKASNYESRSLQVGDIVFEVSGGSKDQLLGRTLLITDGILKYCDKKVICASFCKLIRPSISALFLKQYLQAYYDCGLVGTYQIQSTGISNYQFEDFLKYQRLIVPDKNILTKFDSHCGSFQKKIDILAMKNVYLKQTRDRLLPRLMSGKIDVEKMDIHFPASMEAEVTASA